MGLWGAGAATQGQVVKTQYAQVPLDVLKFLANLLSILARHRLSNPVFEYEKGLIMAELDRRTLGGEVHRSTGPG